MAKVLPEHRRQVGNFEIIDVPDEGDVAALRSNFELNLPMRVRWNEWDYGSDSAALRKLYEKGKRMQWNATDDIDWSIEVPKDQFVGDPATSLMANMTKLLGKDEATQAEAMYDEVAWLFSQLLHGEQAALQICGQLTNLCPTTDEKFYAANQTNDEARHCEVFAKLLTEKFGTIYDVSPVSKALLDEILAVDDYQKKTLGMQTLFEGFAMGLMDMIRQAVTNPLLKDVLRRVEIDESRHAAFGVLTMRRVVETATEQEMHELEDWALKLLEGLNANQNMTMLRELGPKYGVDPDLVTAGMLGNPEWANMNSVVYMHTVIPNLLRLGLISDRTEARYRELGMLTDIRAAKEDGPIQPELG